MFVRLFVHGSLASLFVCVVSKLEIISGTPGAGELIAVGRRDRHLQGLAEQTHQQGFKGNFDMSIFK